MKRSRLFILSALAASLLMALVIPMKVQADGLPFSVSPVQSKLQRDPKESYYDVVVGAGKSTPLQTKLVNSTNKPVKVNVTVTAAQTNDNGAVDYSLSQKRDATLRHDLADALQGPKTVTLPAKATVTYTATLHMPAVDGLMVGALTFSPADQGGTKTKQGQLSIVNKFQYQIAVITRNTNRTWQPKLRLQQAQIRQDQYRNTIAVPVHNPSGTFLNQLRIEASATNQASGKHYQRTQKDMQMAPNSHFYYRLALPQNAQAGKYEVTTKAYYVKDPSGKYVAADGTHYQYARTQKSAATLTAAKARQLNRKIQQAKGGTPWFVYAIFGVIGVLVLIIIALVVVLVKKRHKQ
ncbi:WxL protein peptidoglycan domain-containing protein [Lacticaseibacillus jixianensis]|uniref:WxL protein peptidoglycan domain-containing protein n=1 Tax=Lacticaseibacillus jixianensis TaxID=2486012 RepID=A0ABW4BEE5_9LACO|nr:DUF916 domain-containing protein [Lacticaseibacillus jixianensis]